MSHKFSFLQAFTGYYSWKRKLLSTCRQKNWLKSSSVGLRVECNQQVSQMKLAANMDKSRTQICQIAAFFQIASDLCLSVDVDSAYKYLKLVADTLVHATTEYINRYNIQHLRKYLSLSWLGWDFSQYEYLLQNLDFANINPLPLRKKDWLVNNLPRNHHNIYLPFRFSQNCN